MTSGMAGLTIFILFFSAATLDAIQTRNWARSVFWLAIGIVFLVAANLRNRLQ